ncbi:MAG: hypothetical protein LBT97_02005 [Planctomycetota bacterium]|nr:hypothetical protein [Planctomycetota bacterium]
MKTGRRLVLGLILFAAVSAPLRANGGEASSAPPLLFVGSIASPSRFIEGLDGFASALFANTGTAFEPGSIAKNMLTNFPLPVNNIDMDAPMFFIVPAGATFDDLCAVVRVPDYDEFLKGLDHTSLINENEEGSAPRISAHLPGFGYCWIMRGDDHTALLGQEFGVLQAVQGMYGSLSLEHPGEWLASVSFPEPIRLDLNAALASGGADMVREIESSRPRLSGMTDALGMNSGMLMGFLDLARAVIEGAVAEAETLKDVRLSVNFDKDNFDASLALTPDAGSALDLMRSAVLRLAGGDRGAPKLAAAVPSGAIALKRYVTPLQDPDYREKLAEWIALAADKLAPARKDEWVAAFGDLAASDPSEAVQALVSRADRDLSIAYIKTGDAEAFIKQYDASLRLAADLVNAFVGEAPGKGLSLRLRKESAGHGDMYVFDPAMSAGSKLAALYNLIPRDEWTQIDQALSSFDFLIGWSGDTVVIVSGPVLPEDLAYAIGVVETPGDVPLVSLPEAVAALARTPGGESGFYSVVDYRGLADLAVNYLRRQGETLGFDPDELNALSSAFVGGRRFAGISTTADVRSLFFNLTAGVPGLNEANRNYSKIFQYLYDGNF